MTFLKSALAKGAIVAVLASSALATAASAGVACNRAGECWRVQDRYDYPVGVGITFHTDDWARGHRHAYHWRGERHDRGYYRNGVWIAF